jgi:hypothetical protein
MTANQANQLRGDHQPAHDQRAERDDRGDADEFRQRTRAAAHL